MRAISRRPCPAAVLVLGLTITSWTAAAEGPLAVPALSGDCPQWGGSPQRNNTPDGSNIPAEWNVGEFDRKTGDWLKESAKNIKWVARLGTTTYGTPVIADGKVFCATNNGGGRLQRYPAEVDLGCLLCFRQAEGGFLWQLSREKLQPRNALDYPLQGICCAPMVQGDRLWLVTNRGEVVCLDTQGFADGQNDGPFQSEPASGPGEADLVWNFDMVAELGIVQHFMCSCSVTAAGDLLLVNTSNGIDEFGKRVPAPKAPSFIALDKHSGKLIWADSSPGENILDGQWSSPAVAVVGGLRQAVFAGGDGWLYSFLAEPTSGGKPRLLWKFDCNPKESKWDRNGGGDRSSIVGTPVVHAGLVYICTGQDPQLGEGPGNLWCIDPARRGDVSSQLVHNKQGEPVPFRSVGTVDEQAGERVVPNPNSAALWHFTGHDADGDGELEFEETMHRSLGMVAIKDGLLMAADTAGLVLCLDAKTGRLHWTHDLLSTVWGSPLIVDGKVYIGNEDFDVVVFRLSAKKQLLAKNNMGDSVYTTPVVAHNTLYISTRTRLFAISSPR